MNRIDIPTDLTGKRLFDWLVKNKALLEASKKAQLKHADAFIMRGSFTVNDKGEVGKAIGDSVIPETATALDAVLVINTTNIMDSHKDVHMPGLWKKSIQEQRDVYLLQEHVMSFANVISDNVKAMTKMMSWMELGYAAPGITEALLFKTRIEKDRNPFMFEQYRKGYVKNHSVGMRYVKIKMAINDEDYKEEFSVWTDYIDQVVNRADAEASGYFWVVTEAKIVEGSAVVKGSNFITPAYSIEAAKSAGTGEEPPSGTPNQPHAKAEEANQGIRWDKLASAIEKSI